METKKNKIIKLDSAKPDMLKIKEAAQIVKNGGLVVFPTDTVYGLGTNALLVKSVRKIYRIKKRELSKPIIFLVAHKDDVKKLVMEIPSFANKLINKFWPGPLTLIFKANSLACMIAGGLGTISFRIPNNKIALSLISEAGIPIATTSANISGKKSVTSALSANRQLKDKVDLIIDGGKSRLGIESTIVDVTVFPPQLVREGYITKNKILKILELE